MHHDPDLLSVSYLAAVMASGTTQGVDPTLSTSERKRRFHVESKKKTSQSALPPLQHERTPSSSDSPVSSKSKLAGESGQRTSRSDGGDKISIDKPRSGSPLLLTSPKKPSQDVLISKLNLEMPTGLQGQQNSSARAAENEALSASPMESPRLPGIPSCSNSARFSPSNRTPSPRFASLNRTDSSKHPLSPAKRSRRYLLKPSCESRPAPSEALSPKYFTTSALDDINVHSAPLYDAPARLRRVFSEPFFASWDYGNLEADFTLPSGTHISSHYDRLQTRGSQRRRKRLAREESKRLPARDFHLISDLHAKLTADEKEDADVLYEEERHSEREIVVAAGTASKLFSLLADHRIQDKEYIDVYLATHLRFISTAQLFDQLLERFRNPLAKLVTSSSAALTPEETKEYIPLIQMRIVNVFKKWLRYHYAYEFDDHRIATQMEAFINELSNSEHEEHVQYSAFLRSSWEKRHMTNFDAYEADASDAPKVLVPSITEAADLSLLDVHPTELARQLTIVHQNMFHRVRNNHLLQFLKDKDDPGNPVGEIATFSAKLTNWVCYELASTATVKKRVQVYANFVKLCVALKNICNFQGALDIFLGLNNYLVSRLRKTIKNVDSSTKDKLKQLAELFDTAGGLKNLRRHIRASHAPLIIPASIWLHDLILIDENEDYMHDQTPESACSPLANSADSLSALTATPCSSNNSSPTWSPIGGAYTPNSAGNTATAAVSGPKLSASCAVATQKELMLNFHKLRLFSNTFAEVYRCQLEPYVFSPLPVLQEYISKHLYTTTPQTLEDMINAVVTSQEARKDASLASSGHSSSSSSASSSSSSSSGSIKSSGSGAPPKSPSKGLSRKTSLTSLFRLRINSPSGKREAKDAQ